MGVAIRTAGEGDRDTVVRLLDEAFQDDPVSGWVFPGEEYRRRTHHRLMGAFTDIVLADGWIDLTEDGAACALWLSVPGEEDTPQEPAEEPAEDAEDVPAQVREAVDPDNERVESIARLTEDIHPSGPAHAYLWMIGVAPERQGRAWGPRSSRRSWTGATATACPPIWRRAANAAKGSTNVSASRAPDASCTCRTAPGCGRCGVTRDAHDAGRTRTAGQRRARRAADRVRPGNRATGENARKRP